jgi:hypothetical protein
MRFILIEHDHFATIVYGDMGGAAIHVGRALTNHDGERIVEALNLLNAGADIRDRIQDAVHDAIEGCFDDAGNRIQLLLPSEKG